MVGNPEQACRLQALPGNLVEHTASAPQVHLVGVEAICQQALRGPVPARGDVLRVRLFGVDAPAGAEVPKLQDLLLQGKQASL